jgi:hypothetical protein
MLEMYALFVLWGLSSCGCGWVVVVRRVSRLSSGLLQMAHVDPLDECRGTGLLQIGHPPSDGLLSELLYDWRVTHKVTNEGAQAACYLLKKVLMPPETLAEFRTAWLYALQQQSLGKVKVAYAKQLAVMRAHRSSNRDVLLDNANFMKTKLGEPDDYCVDLDFMTDFQLLSARYFDEVENLDKNMEYVTPQQVQGLLYDDNDERHMISPAAQFLLTRPNDPVVVVVVVCCC